MKISVSVIRLVALIVGTGVIAAFVHAYSTLQANWLQHGYNFSLTVLPLPTMFYHRYSPLGYVLPLVAALFLVPMLTSKKVAATAESNVRWEVLVMLLALVALIWVVACVLAWQLPHYYPTGSIN